MMNQDTDFPTASELFDAMNAYRKLNYQSYVDDLLRQFRETFRYAARQGKSGYLAIVHFPDAMVNSNYEESMQQLAIFEMVLSELLRSGIVIQRRELRQERFEIKVYWGDPKLLDPNKGWWL